MRTIHKYDLPVNDEVVEIKLPTQAKFLHAQCQQDVGTVQLWFEVDTDMPLVTRRYTVVGTGHPINERATENSRWVATTVPHSQLVWHVYQVVDLEVGS